MTESIIGLLGACACILLIAALAGLALLIATNND